jgi:hypothetical protein
MSIKLVALDIDGTLLNPRGEGDARGHAPRSRKFNDREFWSRWSPGAVSAPRDRWLRIFV